MSREAIPADTAGDVQAPPAPVLTPPAPVLTPPAGFVECITTRPSWQGGQQVPVGTPVLLSKSDASYAESIGRVCRVAEDPL